MEPLRRHLSYSNVMSTIAVFAIVGGGAFAIGAIPDGSGKINACYVKTGKRAGDVRLLVKGTKCRRGERKIAWNQRGVAGPTGPAGTAGLAGPAGEPNPNAANAELLDSLDSTAFLRSDAAAGGDLTGAFPAPQIGDNAIGAQEGKADPDDEIADGSIDSDDVAPSSINASHIIETGLNADLVDSMHTQAQALHIGAGGASTFTTSTLLTLALNCDGTGAASISVTNGTGGNVVSYIDTGGTDPTFGSLAPGQGHLLPAVSISPSDLITWHLSSTTANPVRMETYLIGIDESGSDCDFYIRELWTAA